MPAPATSSTWRTARSAASRSCWTWPWTPGARPRWKRGARAGTERRTRVAARLVGHLPQGPARPMNLPLHTGLLGCLEAGLIAFLVGGPVYGLWSWLGRRTGMQIGHQLGWGAVIATVIAAGLDTWNLFYIGMVKLESPLYARLALQGIHDADNLGTRVMLEVIGAVSGAVLGWWLFSHRNAPHDAGNGPDQAA